MVLSSRWGGLEALRAYQMVLSMCDVQTTNNSNRACNHHLSVNAPTAGVPTRAVAEP